MQTKPGDILLIHHKGQAQVFARVEEITADHKPGWWRLRMTVLQVPPQELSWILREEYIDGQEFTMSGDPIRLEPLPPVAEAPPPPEAEPVPEPAPGPDPDAPGKVLSLDQRRKKT